MSRSKVISERTKNHNIAVEIRKWRTLCRLKPCESPHNVGIERSSFRGRAQDKARRWGMVRHPPAGGAASSIQCAATTTTRPTTNGPPLIFDPSEPNRLTSDWTSHYLTPGYLRTLLILYFKHRQCNTSYKFSPLLRWHVGPFFRSISQST